MSWGGWAWAWAGEKKPRKKEKEGKKSLTREFRQPLGPSIWMWGRSQALFSFHWLGIASGDGYLSDRRANHVSVPDRPPARILGWDRIRGKPTSLHVPEPEATLLFGWELKWRVGQPNRTSDFHFSPCVPLQPSLMSQRDRHGFPSSRCGSSRHGMLSSALGWRQARNDLSEGHRACVAASLCFQSSMNGSEGLRGKETA